jgi:hypothetical protein
MSAVVNGAGKVVDFVDQRITASNWLKRNIRKVFPDHWSFLLGEIALFSFIIILLSGVFLTLWFKPSMAHIVYEGAYTPMRGVGMSEAYATTLDLSFEVRGGLLMRQVHHWGALIFLAAMSAHMLRVFFTGAFRKPREADRCHPAGPGRGGRFHRLLPPRRPAVRHGPAHHRGRHARHPDRRHLRVVVPVRRRVPGRRHHRPALPHAHPADPGAHPGAGHGAPHDPLVPEAHPLGRPGQDQRERRRCAVLPDLRRQGRWLPVHRHGRHRPAGRDHPDQPGRPAPSPTGTSASSTARCA